MTLGSRFGSFISGAFLFVLGPSWKTTLAGYAAAGGMAAISYIGSNTLPGADPAKAQVFWAGLATAVAVAIKGRFTQDQIAQKPRKTFPPGDFRPPDQNPKYKS